MFDFIKPKTQPEVHLPDDWIERLDNIAKQLVLLEHQNNELRRTLVRVETKMSKMAIALGCGSAVTRN